MTSIKIKSSKEKKIEVKRGEVYLIRFDPLKKGKFKKIVKNTEIKNPHPAVVISNDIQNKKSNRITVVPLTHTLKPFYESWEIKVRVNNQAGKIMCDQIRNFDKKKRLIRKVGVMPAEIIKQVEEKLKDLIW